MRSFEGQSHSYGALAQKAFAATAPSSQTSSCFTSTESYPYESLDEQCITPSVAEKPGGNRVPQIGDSELTQSLPSCSQVTSINIEEPPEMELMDQSLALQQSLMQQHQNYQLVR